MFKHDESTQKSIATPRHPLVVLIDIFGILITSYFIFQSEHWSVTMYLCTILMMYSASILHHWLRSARWHTELDHLMIYLVIAMTALPFWALYIPFNTITVGYVIIGLVILLGVVARLFLRLPNRISLYIYGSLVTLLSLYFVMHFSAVATPYNWLWILGTFIYMIQACTLGFKWYNLSPTIFGYREVQHFLLILATSIHGYVAISL